MTHDAAWRRTAVTDTALTHAPLSLCAPCAPCAVNGRLSFEEAFALFMRDQRHGEYVLTDATYDAIVRTIRTEDKKHPKWNQWTKKKYIVRPHDTRPDEWTLHLNIDMNKRVIRKQKGRRAAAVVSPDADDSSGDEESAASETGATAGSGIRVPQLRLVRVAKESEIPHLIAVRHEAAGHSGSRATSKHIALDWIGVPRILCEAFVFRCEKCNCKKPKSTSRYEIVAVESGSFGERVQLDLFEMQRVPGGPNADMRYVMHWQDHFSKFSLLRAIKNKTAAAVCEQLQSIFNLFGAPRILHTDNGTEFCNALITDLALRWGCAIRHGRAYHPQSQGSVEKANQLAKSKLAVWMSDQPVGTDWVPQLDNVQWQINTQHREHLKMSPYQLVFNRAPTLGPGMDLESPQTRSQLFEGPDEDEPRDLTPEDAHAHLEQHEEGRAAAAASSSDYRANFVQQHNSHSSTPTFKPGDFVTVQLHKKHLSVLTLPRMLMMVLRKLRGEGPLYRLYCEYGQLKDGVHGVDLEPAPECIRPAELNWDVKEIEHRHREALRIGAKPNTVTMEQVCTLRSKDTHKQNEPTSTQTMNARKRGRKTTAQPARDPSPPPAAAARKTKKPKAAAAAAES